MTKHGRNIGTDKMSLMIGKELVMLVTKQPLQELASKN